MPPENEPSQETQPEGSDSGEWDSQIKSPPKRQRRSGESAGQWAGQPHPPKEPTLPPSPPAEAAQQRSPQAAGASNIVPLPGIHTSPQARHASPQPPSQEQQHVPLLPSEHRLRRHHWQHHDWDQSNGQPPLDEYPAAPFSSLHKITLLFDFNGTITSLTSLRHSGIHRARPGIHHLRRLQEHFRLGIYSSASGRTISEALQLLNEAAGPGSPLFDPSLTLQRKHTALAPLAHLVAGGKESDTVKPLRPYFSRLHRVLLVDDDSYKACPGEERNLVHMPCWEGHDTADNKVGCLVEVLLQVARKLQQDPEADVRHFTAAISAKLRGGEGSAVSELSLKPRRRYSWRQLDTYGAPWKPAEQLPAQL